MVLAALAWTAFGCGDDDGNGAGDGEGSTRELEQLVSALEDVTNSPTRSSIDMDIESGREDVSMSGQMESQRGEARLEVDFEQGGQAIAMEIVQHEAAAWMRSPSLQALLPPGKSWIQTTDPEVVGGGTLTPAQFGELIEDAGQVDDLGRARRAAGFLRGLSARDVQVPLDAWLGPPVRWWPDSASTSVRRRQSRGDS